MSCNVSIQHAGHLICDPLGVTNPQAENHLESQGWVCTHLYSSWSQLVKSVKLTDYTQNNISECNKSKPELS